MSISSSQLYAEAVERLSQAGIAHARREVLWIVEAALGVNASRLYAYGDDVIDSKDYQHTMDLIRRRASREPLQYVLGSQEFFGLDFLVNSDVLIPRPESELLVADTIALLSSHRKPIILDIGTGSGCLAISLAVYLNHAMIVASDRSILALRMAQRNTKKHGVSSQILWVTGDLLAPLLSGGLVGKVSAIIANLPYISHAEWDRLSPDVKEFEPRLALDGGPDGLDVYRCLLKQAPEVLAPNGFVLIELGLGQDEALCREVAASGVFEVVKLQPDNQGIPRMARLQYVGNS